jgi:thioredoxin reductase (NADPH)
MQEALTLAETVDTVLMLVRGDALAGQGVYRDAVAAAANIQVRFGVTAEEVLGQDTVTALRVRTGFGAEEIAVAAVFPFVGLAPNTALLAGLAPLAAGGRVLTDADLRAGPRGLFAAGTVRDGTAGRAAAAAGDGAAAALAADRYLTDGAWPANH